MVVGLQDGVFIDGQLLCRRCAPAEPVPRRRPDSRTGNNSSTSNSNNNSSSSNSRRQSAQSSGPAGPAGAGGRSAMDIGDEEIFSKGRAKSAVQVRQHCVPLPSRLRHCLHPCVFSLPLRPRHCLCPCVFPLASRLRHCLSLRFSRRPSLSRTEDSTRGSSTCWFAPERHCLSLRFPCRSAKD